MQKDTSGKGVRSTKGEIMILRERSGRAQAEGHV